MEEEEDALDNDLLGGDDDNGKDKDNSLDDDLLGSDNEDCKKKDE